MLHELDYLIGILLEVRLQIVTRDLNNFDIADSNYGSASGILLDDSHLTEILAFLKHSYLHRIILAVIRIYTGLTFEKAEETLACIAFLDDNFTVPE